MEYFDIRTYVIAILFPTLTIMAWGNVVNDYADWDSDVINNKRPSGQGEIQKNGLILTLIVTFLIVVISIVISTYLLQSSLLFITYLIVIALLILYSLELKRMPLIGNVIVASLAVIGVALPYAYVSFNYNEIELLSELKTFLLFFFGLIFSFSLVREILKDIEDIKGDRAIGYKTLPIVSGLPKSRKLVIVLSVFNLLLINIWMIMSNIQLSLILFLFAAIPSIVFFILYYRKTSVAKLSIYLKTQMFIASFILIAFKYL